MAVMGVLGSFTSKPTNTERPWELLMGVLTRRTLRKLSHTTRPCFTAYTMVAKLSSAKIISDASRATSVPSLPIATPMLAALSAGASFTPSPVILVTWPSAWRAFTIRILFWGDARANTLWLNTHLQSSPSLMASSSGPVTASLNFSSTIPSMCPIAVAVSLWSPVIMATRTPAPWASLIACTHSGRGGSIIAQRPTIVSHFPSGRPFTNSGPRLSPGLTLSLSTKARHKPRTRRPWELRMAICSIQYSSLTGSMFSSPPTPPLAWNLHCFTILSGAPLTYAMSLPAGALSLGIGS
mmetsp:Transcript_19664/g.33826  ORF Transcript_19664/g.33826 Transcript_19664/m.33826 type:complete len:296 (+) Transcript_19664:964-1851(+)